jgi:double-stranded uracil-DNA glycosylase
VDRATATAAELTPAELRVGRATLGTKMARARPRTVAVLGITAYRSSFGRPRAALGPQDDDIAGVPAWVLPNPSGLNAHHQIDDLVHRFDALRAAVGVR